MATPQPEHIPSEDALRQMLANNLTHIVQTFINNYKLPYRIEGNELKDALAPTDLWLKRLVSVDPTIVALKADIHALAKCDDEVLIVGETGVDKELIAQSMIGSRTGKFIAVNCAGLPETLIESELFGYKKGSFTGADGDRQGLMAVAKDGVLFLDEIGELPLSVQAKLLRALQDKVVRRVGGKDEEPVSCKFVCATHRDIRKMVTEDKFRQDLYARISTFELHIPPLSQRECDIKPILESMLGGKAFLVELNKQGHALHKLDLSLNVRSLQKYVKRFNVLGRIDV